MHVRWYRSLAQQQTHKKTIHSVIQRHINQEATYSVYGKAKCEEAPEPDVANVRTHTKVRNCKEHSAEERRRDKDEKLFRDS